MAPKVMVKKGVKFAAKAKAATGFDNPATKVGDSKWVGSDGKPISVYYDPASQGGLALATDILQNRIDDIMAFCDDAYQTKGQQGDVLIVPGNSGAYHYGCSWNSSGQGNSDWYEDDMGLTAPTTNNNGGIVTGLVMAEVTESYMGASKGWNCGGSGGEALSRIFAETASGGIAGAMSSGFSARSSYDGTDWISKDQGTDQDYPSIGCGMLYMDWMRSLGYTLQQIVRAGESDGSLASNYAALTGKPASQAFADFTTAVGKVDINATNPFNIKDTPFPGGTTPPPPPPSGGAIVLAQSLAAGTYPITDAAGKTVANLTATNPVGAGTYPISTAAGGTLAVTAATAPGSYSVSGLGSMSVLSTLAVGQIYNVTGTAGAAITFPPWLLALLKFACAFAPSAPPPYGPVLALLCSLLPAEHRGKPVSDAEMLQLKVVLEGAYAKRGISPCS